MKAESIYSLLLTALMGAQLPAAFAAPLPGTPLAGVFGPQDIVEGGNLLPTQVEPGDIVMQENPLGGVNRGNWSDIVRFFNVGGMGFAYLISDSNEAGVRNIDINIVDSSGARTTLPDTLSTNSLFINEVQAGTGTPADLTPLAVPGATYNIHSDAASPDTPNPILPKPPGAPIPPPGGPNINLLFVILENTAAADGGPGQVIPLGANVQPGTATILDPNGAFSDNLSFLSVGNTSFLVIQSDVAVAGLLDVPTEIYTATDEGSASTYVLIDQDVAEVPEPSAILLLGTGLIVFAGVWWHPRSPRNREISWSQKR